MEKGGEKVAFNYDASPWPLNVWYTSNESSLVHINARLFVCVCKTHPSSCVCKDSMLAVDFGDEKRWSIKSSVTKRICYFGVSRLPSLAGNKITAIFSGNYHLYPLSPGTLYFFLFFRSQACLKNVMEVIIFSFEYESTVSSSGLIICYKACVKI